VREVGWTLARGNGSGAPVVAVLGTRPEVIKMAPVVHALRSRGIAVDVVSTGQHHDWPMMGSFLETFGLRADHELTVASHDLLGSFVSIVDGLGRLFLQAHPRLVLAVGDTTSVVAAAFAAHKSGATFGHVEAGLRAFSRELPEEEHRICADALADLAFAPTSIARDNLLRERINGAVVLTGNTVLDALLAHPPPVTAPSERDGILVTLHRQETVDDPDRLRRILSSLAVLARHQRVEWPIHPRARARMAAHHLEVPPGLLGTGPLGHEEFLERLARCRVVVTDSGGVQEEAAILGTPCVVVRRHTERPETIEAGVAVLSGLEVDGVLEATRQVLHHWERYAHPAPGLYGDGRAGERIAEACALFLANPAAVVSGDGGGPGVWARPD
jgi:UDP-N-acetylglucosamine 2-epimerase (non-hydrolysing)